MTIQLKSVGYKLLLCCIIGVGLLLSAGSMTALADNIASDRLLIYNQNSGNAAGGSNDGQQACRNLALRGSNTMGSSGCGIYAMAHAYQWLTGDKRSTSNAVELLQMFINSNINAGSNAPWEGFLDTKYGKRCFPELPVGLDDLRTYRQDGGGLRKPVWHQFCGNRGLIAFGDGASETH